MKKQIKIKKIQSLNEIKENDGYTILTSHSLEDITSSLTDSIRDLVKHGFISSYNDITRVYFLETENESKGSSGFYKHNNAVVFAFADNAKCNLPKWHNTICKVVTGFTSLFKLKQNND